MAGYYGVTAFLLCAWEELLDHNTPDSYQPRLLHSFALLEELATTSRWALRSERWGWHIPHLIDELVQALKYEEDIFKGAPGLSTHIRTLADISDPAALESSARVIRDTSPPLSELIHRALGDFVVNLPKQKKSVIKVIRVLATEALRAGADASDLKQLCSESNLTRKPEEVVEQMMATIAPIAGVCRCIFSIEGKSGDLHSIMRNIDDLKSFRFLNVESRPKDKDAEDFFVQHGATNYIEFTVDGVSPSAAARVGSLRLRRACDLFNFYQNDISLKIANQTLVETSGQSRIVRPSDRSSRLLFSRRDSRERTRQVLTELGTGRLEGRLINALEHHTLAHISTDPKIKLVNLWSALECLVGPGKGSTVDRVSECITPIIVWRRIDKLVRYLAIYLHRFGFCGKRKPPKSLFRSSTAFRVSVEEILIATTRSKDHEEIVALIDSTAPHPFLRFRIYQTWEIMSCPKNLARAMDESIHRLRWQIIRIYRARNLIVHHGEDIPSALHLFDNIQSYFSLALSRILHDQLKHPSWRIDDSIAYRRMRFKYVMESLRLSPENLCVKDFIPSPAVFSDHVLWPKSE